MVTRPPSLIKLIPFRLTLLIAALDGPIKLLAQLLQVIVIALEMSVGRAIAVPFLVLSPMAPD